MSVAAVCKTCALPVLPLLLPDAGQAEQRELERLLAAYAPAHHHAWVPS